VTGWEGEDITLGWKNLVLAAGDRDIHAQALSVLAGGS
jgi:hypothetical protein